MKVVFWDVHLAFMHLENDLKTICQLVREEEECVVTEAEVLHVISALAINQSPAVYFSNFIPNRFNTYKMHAFVDIFISTTAGQHNRKSVLQSYARSYNILCFPIFHLILHKIIIITSLQKRILCVWRLALHCPEYCSFKTIWWIAFLCYNLRGSILQSLY